MKFLFLDFLHRSTLQAQLDEQTRLGEDEAKERSLLLGKFRNLVRQTKIHSIFPSKIRNLFIFFMQEHEYDLLRDSLEEGHHAKSDAARRLGKANAEV